MRSGAVADPDDEDFSGTGVITLPDAPSNRLSRTAERRKRMVVNRAADFAAAEKWDLDFWQSCTAPFVSITRTNEADPESLVFRIFLRNMEGGAREAVTNGGAGRLAWTSGGDELLFNSGGEMFTVAVDTENGCTVGGQPVAQFGSWTSLRSAFDVSGNGERILAIKNLGVGDAGAELVSRHLNVWLNWTKALESLAPPRR